MGDITGLAAVVMVFAIPLTAIATYGYYRVSKLRTEERLAALDATLVATAGPLTSEVEIPTGDVWITPEAPHPAPAQIARRTPVPRPLPTGDIWPADDEATRTAEAPALPRDQSAAREDDGR